MTLINLLPWREQIREERKRQFLVVLVASAILAALIVFGGHVMMSKRLTKQTHRNDFLKTEISQLDQKILDIKSLQKQKALLLTRMNIILELQGDRPKVVHLFEQIVQVLPKGVHLTDVSRKGNVVRLDGLAESNTNVSDLMRNINRSSWLASPVLNEIKTDEQAGKQISEFSLRMVLVRPAMSTASQEKR